MNCKDGRGSRWFLGSGLSLVFLLWAGLGCGGGGYSGSSDNATESAGGGGSGAAYTIVLAQYTQIGSDYQAQELMLHAKKVLKTEDIWLLNEKNGLYVNYGHFSSQTGKIEREFERVKKIYYDQIQAGPYQFCFIREIPRSSTPPAPPEWNLLQNRCAATLEIGCYYNVPEKDYFSRKEDAIQAVKSLRAAGEQAFYVHGQYESRIYIGCVGKAADAEKKLKSLQQKNPYRYENGGLVYSVIYDQNHQRIRIPHPSVIRYVEDIRRDLSF